LNGKETTLTFGPAAVLSLQAQGVTQSAVAPATASPAGGISFPITGGSIDTKTNNGSIKHSGGLKLTAPGNKTLTFSDVVIDTTTGLMSATVEGTSYTVLQLKPLAAAPVADGSGVTFTGTAATLQSNFAIVVNEALGIKAFTPNQSLGTVVVNATFAK
jgi:hypothetical protein